MSLCFLSARVLPSFFHLGFSNCWSAACNISPSEIKFKKEWQECLRSIQGMQAALDCLSGMNEFIIKWKSHSFLRACPLKNNHTPAKYKLIYSAHYNHFSLIQTTEGLDLKGSRGSSCRKRLCVSSDGRKHSFLCSCNVFGHIMSPQKWIKVYKSDRFSFCDGCVMWQQAFGKHNAVFLHLHDHKHFISGLTGPLSLLNHSQFAYWLGLL